MRTSAIAAALVALFTLANLLSAEDDFSALLADLSFGDSPTLSEPENSPLTVTDNQPAPSFQPAPTGMLMPGMADTKPISEPTPEPAVAPEVEATPRVALQDPVPAVTAEIPDQVDLDAAFALQAMQSANTTIPSQVVGHVHSGCAQSGCDGHDQCGCGYGGCGNGGCGHNDTEVVCRPRNPVNLPHSSLRQYFRSNPCYTNVWDGYRQHCGDHHKHLHGECDCFKQKSRGGACGCQSQHCQPRCESGCDR
jgi:hypothetical protein